MVTGSVPKLLLIKYNIKIERPQEKLLLTREVFNTNLKNSCILVEDGPPGLKYRFKAYICVALVHM